MAKIVSSIQVLPWPYAGNIIVPFTERALLPCGNPPRRHFDHFAVSRPAISLAADFRISTLKRYHGLPACCTMPRNRVRHRDRKAQVSLAEFRRVNPGNTPWPVSFPPEIRQDIKQKDSAQDVQYKEYCHTHWNPFPRRRGPSRD
jgi:hypothetical protein